MLQVVDVVPDDDSVAGFSVYGRTQVLVVALHQCAVFLFLIATATDATPVSSVAEPATVIGAPPDSTSVDPSTGWVITVCGGALTPPPNPNSYRKPLALLMYTSPFEIAG